MPSRPIAVMTFEHTCSQCGNVWRSDVEKPRQCPSDKCWSRKWDKPGPFSHDEDKENPAAALMNARGDTLQETR